MRMIVVSGSAPAASRASRWPGPAHGENNPQRQACGTGGSTIAGAGRNAPHRWFRQKNIIRAQRVVCSGLVIRWMRIEARQRQTSNHDRPAGRSSQASRPRPSTGIASALSHSSRRGSPVVVDRQSRVRARSRAGTARGALWYRSRCRSARKDGRAPLHVRNRIGRWKSKRSSRGSSRGTRTSCLRNRKCSKHGARARARRQNPRG